MHVPSILTVAVAAGLWLVWAWASARLVDNPRRDVGYGIGLAFVKLYVRLVHRPTTNAIPGEFRDVEYGDGAPLDTPSMWGGGGLVVVVNHTAGVDPVLVSAALPFEVRWMMARDMMIPALSRWWRWVGVIPVDRPAEGGSGQDASAARDAIRILQAGGVVGVFPEGGLERPARTLRPFAAGVGLLVKRTKARVLPVLIEGAPQTQTAFGSLLAFSRSRVTFLPVMDFRGTTLGAEAITARIFEVYQRTTGWPVSAPTPT